MDRKTRIANLEARLQSGRVSWKLKDGTEVSAETWDILDCLMSVMKKDYHPLLEKIREADKSTYSGRGAIWRTLYDFCNSDEYYFKH